MAKQPDKDPEKMGKDEFVKWAKGKSLKKLEELLPQFSVRKFGFHRDTIQDRIELLRHRQTRRPIWWVGIIAFISGVSSTLFIMDWLSR